MVSLTEQNRRLEHLLNELRRAMFGKKSEKLDPDQLLLAFEELEGALAEAGEEAPADTMSTPRAKRPAAQRNLGHLPAYLPRTYRVADTAQYDRTLLQKCVTDSRRLTGTESVPYEVRFSAAIRGAVRPGTRRPRGRSMPKSRPPDRSRG